MNGCRYWVAISLFAVACSGGGSSSDSGPQGTGGSATGSGGSATTGTGGSATGTGGNSTTGTGGSVATGTGGMTGTGGTKTDGGTDGAAGSPGSGGMGAPASLSWLERNGDIGKTGHAIRPMLTKAKAATIAADTGFNATFQGSVWNSPLYMEKGANQKGTFFVASAGNVVYAFDETTGAMVWMRNLGSPATQQACGCCNYGLNQGVFSTPVIDEASRTLFAVAAQGPNGISSFKAYALSVDDGTVKTGWPITIPGTTPQTNQRAALALVKGILYIGFGGHQGDCPTYNGRVFAINISNPTMTGSWSTSSTQSAIWAAGGLASDGDGIFAVTGNAPASGNHQDSEELIRLTGLAVANKTNANVFYPSRWQSMDGMADLDFGCNAPTILNVAGATPSKFVVAPAKDGHVYFLDPANLGGMGGEKFDLQIAQESMSTRTAPTAYMTTKGAFIALSTTAGRCPQGAGATGNVIMGVQVGVTAGAIAPKITWCAALAGSDGGDPMVSPISTTSDGMNDAIVWYVTISGNLRGVDGETGAMIAQGTGCPVKRWTAPIVGGAGRIVAASSSGKLCSWSVK